MPGSLFELSLDDALAVVAAHAHEPEALLWKCSPTEQDMLLVEARRVIQWHAFEVAERCFPPPVSNSPTLKLVQR